MTRSRNSDTLIIISTTCIAVECVIYLRNGPQLELAVMFRFM